MPDHKSSLEIAVAAWREVEASEEGSPEPHGRGRPIGSRNRRSDELARWYIAQNDGRHPLARNPRLDAPYVAPRQAQLEIRNPGAPGSGQPILWTIDEAGELVDGSHDGEELRAIISSD